MSHSTGHGRTIYNCELCKRPRCKHLKSCPSCQGLVFQYDPPVRGHATANNAWLCARCPAIVCMWCYHVHTVVCFAAEFRRPDREEERRIEV